MSSIQTYTCQNRYIQHIIVAKFLHLRQLPLISTNSGSQHCKLNMALGNTIESLQASHSLAAQAVCEEEYKIHLEFDLSASDSFLPL